MGCLFSSVGPTTSCFLNVDPSPPPKKKQSKISPSVAGAVSLQETIHCGNISKPLPSLSLVVRFIFVLFIHDHHLLCRRLLNRFFIAARWPPALVGARCDNQPPPVAKLWICKRRRRAYRCVVPSWPIVNDCSLILIDSKVFPLGNQAFLTSVSASRHSATMAGWQGAAEGTV